MFSRDSKRKRLKSVTKSRARSKSKRPKSKCSLRRFIILPQHATPPKVSHLRLYQKKLPELPKYSVVTRSRYSAKEVAVKYAMKMYRKKGLPPKYVQVYRRGYISWYRISTARASSRSASGKTSLMATRKGRVNVRREKDIKVFRRKLKQKKKRKNKSTLSTIHEEKRQEKKKKRKKK